MVLVVGSVAIDDIATPYGKAACVLGGSASYFSLAASAFAPVQIVAVVGDDFPALHLERLASRGIDVEGVERQRGESFYWSGSYSAELGQATTHVTRLGVFESFEPRLDEAARSARLLFLANIDPDLQLRVLDQMRGPELVVLDTMNFWIHHKLEALERVLGRVDLALLNDEEIRLLTGEHNLVRASARILERGPRGVIVKKGEHGAFLATRGTYFVVPAYPTETVVDPTGAGDSFAGGLLGYLSRCAGIDDAALRRGVARGTVMASFAVEAFSVDRLLAVDRSEVEARLARLREITRFD